MSEWHSDSSIIPPEAVETRRFAESIPNATTEARQAPLQVNEELERRATVLL